MCVCVCVCVNRTFYFFKSYIIALLYTHWWCISWFADLSYDILYKRQQTMRLILSSTSTSDGLIIKIPSISNLYDRGRKIVFHFWPSLLQGRWKSDHDWCKAERKTRNLCNKDGDPIGQKGGSKTRNHLDSSTLWLAFSFFHHKHERRTIAIRAFDVCLSL